MELILVDDCSRDNSLRIISEYASKDSRVKIIESRRNRGTAVAFNKGLLPNSFDDDFYFNVNRLKRINAK